MSARPWTTFAEYETLLRRRWRVLAVCVLIGLLGAGVLLHVAPKRYVATCHVLVLPLRTERNPTAARAARDKVNLDTEAQIVRSAEVWRRVRATLGTPPDLAFDIRVSAPANTTILSLSFAAGSPAQAVRGARAVADAYLATKRADALEVIAARRRTVEKNLAELRAELRIVSAQVLAARNTAARIEAEGRQIVVARQLETLSNRLQDINSTRVDPGRVIRAPATPGRPESPVARLAVPSGAMLGLLVGLLVAGLRNRQDRRLRSAADIARIAPLELLGTVQRTRRAPMAAEVVPGEDARRLALQILRAIEADPGLRVVGFFPVTADVGGLSAEIAIVLARSGRRTALIPSTGNAAAASEVLSAAGMPEILLAPPELRADGSPVDGLPAEFDRTTEVLVVEAPQLYARDDVQTLASWADAAVVVVELGRTRGDRLRFALRQMRDVNAPVLGVVALTRRRPWLAWLRRARRQESAGVGIGSPIPVLEDGPAGVGGVRHDASDVRAGDR